jgi:membrane-associated phospholipid phosphatase
MRRFFFGVFFSIALLFFIESSRADQHREFTDDYSSEVATVWFDTLYQLIKSESIAFPEAARIYGVSAVALYEAVVPGALDHRSLAGQLNSLVAVPQPHRVDQLHWPSVANAALARTISVLFPTLKPENRQAIEALEQQFANRFQAEANQTSNQSRTYKRAVSHGRAVANAILRWAATDGFSAHNNCPYVPPQTPGAWRPTPPNFANAQQPCWSQLRPMILVSGAECPAPPPPDFSTAPQSEFYAAALEVYQTNRTLTEEQRTIAAYWADLVGMTGTSSGHWMAILGQIARNDHLSLAAVAEAYAKLGIAVTDAFITIWEAKYFYNVERPVTYIQDNIDPTWLPFLATPPNPSYISGHSTQSGASATVLTDLFGIKAFTDTTHIDLRLNAQEPRTFSSFDQAAEEAAVSRLYGGIHYSFDNSDGLITGRCVGEAVNDRLQFKN